MCFLCLPNGKTIIYNGNLYYSNNGVPTQIALQSLVQQIESTIDNIQDNSYNDSNKPYIIGNYNGSGTPSRLIDIGFEPTAVISGYKGIFYDGDDGNRYGGIAIQDYPAEDNSHNILRIMPNGFNCYYYNAYRICSNSTDFSYHYIAFK